MSALLPAAQNLRLTGHDDAIALFMQAAASRLHHGWLIHGPEGVGKATLAFHCANYLLSDGRQKIGALDGQERAHKFIASGAHPDLTVLGRPVDDKTGVMKEEIPVDQVRGLNGFFKMTASMGGWRIAIVKRADTLNRNAANALLKILEEPPPRAIILMTATMPGRLLPTIRSRCRPLRLGALDDAAMRALLAPELASQPEVAMDDLLRLAGGSPGRALALLDHDGLQLYRDFVALLQTPPGEQAAALQRLTGGKLDAARFNLIAGFCEDFLARLAHLAATGEAAEMIAGEGQLLRRLVAIRPLGAWFEIADQCRRQFALAQTANLDRRLVMMNSLQQLLN